MNKNDRLPITTSNEPNPLRPYYIPPSISSYASDGASRTPPQAPNLPHPSRSSPSLASKTSDLLPGLDIDLRSSASEAWTNTRALLDTLAWRYASTLMAQPFDVAKIILQVASQNAPATVTPRKRKTSPKSSRQSGSRGRRERAYEAFSEDDSRASEDDDIPDYFTSSAPRSRSPRKRRRTPPSLSPSPDPTPTPSRNTGQRHRDLEEEYQIALKRPDSITNAIAEINRTSGAIGLWRATNCTFLYSVLLRVTDSFVRSLLLALFGLPDVLGPEQGGLAPGLMSGHGTGTSGIDLTDSPNPLASLFVVSVASCVAGILLAPLDLVRTRLVVAPTLLAPRGVLSNIRRLPSLLVPSSLWLPTGLLHSIPSLISASMPLFFRFQMRLSAETMPGAWSLATFSTTLVELFARLPLETILRRAQVKALKDIDPSFPVIVATAPYNGVMGTVYSIMYSEGEVRTKDTKGMVKVQKGQGMAGLIRGWRIGFWGLVGVWSAGALTPANESRRGQF
ncbi:hypothetical protein AMS68_007789 [Peltaster fructicola]|uniref:Uncharacterized protein n=1 Tax=Peltaster fructicola TaxID=286661 RepID=A0A6H0Y5F1_9PEZI|nr:hypothetical protein AMS68_007789 [Peltaster fructicola]